MQTSISIRDRVDQARVSIVVPVFNREKLIRFTVDSVLAQTSNAWELIMVDDGSTDESFPVAMAYANSDSRIKAFKRVAEVKGASTCRNEGLQRASCDNVIFLDSDDLLSPNCVSQRISQLDQDPELDFLVFGVEMFDEAPGDSRDRWCFQSDDCLSDFLDVPLWQTAAPIWRKKFLTRNNLDWKHELSSWQDWDFHVRALAIRPNFKLFPDRVDCYCRRSQTGRITNRSSKSISLLLERADLLTETTRSLGSLGLLQPERKHSLARQFVKVGAQLARIEEISEANQVIQGACKLGLIRPDAISDVETYIKFEARRRPTASMLSRVYRKLRWRKHCSVIPDYVLRRPKNALRLNKRSA